MRIGTIQALACVGIGNLSGLRGGIGKSHREAASGRHADNRGGNGWAGDGSLASGPCRPFAVAGRGSRLLARRTLLS